MRISVGTVARPGDEVAISAVDSTSPRSTREGIALTMGGLLFGGMMLLLAVAALNNQANLLLLLFGIGVSGMMVSVWLSVRSLSKVTVDRTLPRTVVAGQTFLVSYRVTNSKKRAAAYSVYLVDRVRAGGVGRETIEAYAPHVRAGARVKLTVPAVLKRRGPVTFSPIRLESRYPFGLLRYHRRFEQARTLLVLPALLPLNRPWAGKDGLDPETRARRRYRSASWFQGGEIAGLREYRHGDNPRWIHWKKSASSNQLMVHDRRHPPSELLTLVLDLGRVTDAEGRVERDGRRAHELLVSATATLACEALVHGYHVGLIALAEESVVLAPAGGLDQRDRLLSQLAVLRARPETAGPAASLGRMLTRYPRGGTGYLLSGERADALGGVLRHLSGFIGRVQFLHPGSREFREQFRVPENGHSTASWGKSR